MKITLITVGKIKEKFYRDAIAEYSKRLSRYCSLEILELPDEKTPDGASEALETQIKEKEGQRILQSIKEDAYVIALVIQGKQRLPNSSPHTWNSLPYREKAIFAS